MNTVGDFAKELAAHVANNVMSTMAPAIPTTPVEFNDSIMTLEDVEVSIRTTISDFPMLCMHRFKSDQLRLLDAGVSFSLKTNDVYTMAVRFLADGRDHFRHHLTEAGMIRHQKARQILGRLHNVLVNQETKVRFTRYLKIIDDLVATGRCRVWSAETNFTSEYKSAITTFVTGEKDYPDYFSVTFSDDANNFDLPTPNGKGMHAGNYLILRDTGGRLKRVTKFDKNVPDKELIRYEFRYDLSRTDITGHGRKVNDPLIPECLCDHLDIREWITRLEVMEVSTLETSIMYNCVDSQDNVITVTVVY